MWTNHILSLLLLSSYTISFGQAVESSLIDVAYNVDSQYVVLDHLNNNYILSASDRSFMNKCDLFHSNAMLMLNTNEKRMVVISHSPDNFHLLVDGLEGMIHTQICVDPSGRAITSRFIRSEMAIDKDELNDFLCQLLKVKYEENWLSPCIECYLFSLQAKKK